MVDVIDCRPYAHYEILHLSNSADLNRFNNILGSRASNKYIVDKLIDLLLHERPQKEQCKTVIIESEYVDRDYIDAYSLLLSRAFRDYPTRCTVYIFFQMNLKNLT